MPYIPDLVRTDDFTEKLTHYLGAPRQGKVRDTYALPGYDNLLFVVATDRLSIFDFVLGSLVQDKGSVLTAMTILWLVIAKVQGRFAHHLKAFGRDIDQYLPQDLRGLPELQKRALVVHKLDMLPVECVVRGYLTGSGWSAYSGKQGAVCGHLLPQGLHDGAPLPRPIFTPTTKAEVGHDEHISYMEVRSRHGWQPENSSLAIYAAAAKYALHRGIILADTKFEFGLEAGQCVLADEVLTPDSSRFWAVEDWDKAVLQRKSPAGYDKQRVREWGKTVVTPFNKLGVDMETVVGIHNLSPENQHHQRFVGGVQVPVEVLGSSSRRYREAFKRLASMPLEVFQDNTMHVR